jgi:hypothetical protein
LVEKLSNHNKLNFYRDDEGNVTSSNDVMESLIHSIIDPTSYDENYAGKISLDVKSLYKVILTREPCINKYGRNFAKVYVINEFNNIINGLLLDEYAGGWIMNSYITKNAEMLGISFDKSLLSEPIFLEEYHVGNNMSEKEKHDAYRLYILSFSNTTTNERNRVIRLIVDAINDF